MLSVTVGGELIVETMRARAKENLPHVLLTLLSIIQALALELLWGRLGNAGQSLPLSLAGAVYWLQVAATFFGILVIWLVYATNVMRFRWVPGIGDSVHPFVVGLLQFMMIERLEADSVGEWMILLALVFAVMHWVSHITMRRARQEADNAEFFRNVAPATWRDFYPAAAAVFGLGAGGVLVLSMPGELWLALLATAGAFALLCAQMISLRYFWNRSMFAQRDNQ